MKETWKEKHYFPTISMEILTVYIYTNFDIDFEKQIQKLEAR